MRNLDAEIRGKLGEAYAMSPWTEEKLDELIRLVMDYADERYQQGYMAALTDVCDAAERVSYGA